MKAPHNVKPFEGLVRIKSKRVCHRSLYDKVGECFGWWARPISGVDIYDVSIDGKEYSFYQHELEQIDTNYICMFVCKACGAEFPYSDKAEFEDYGEEALWGHIQLDHPEVLEENQNLETPDMLEVCYDQRGWLFK